LPTIILSLRNLSTFRSTIELERIAAMPAQRGGQMVTSTLI
jgi:hypothetical protein